MLYVLITRTKLVATASKTELYNDACKRELPFSSLHIAGVSTL